MALLLDGTPASGTFSSTNTKVLNLTTTAVDTVIVVIVASEKNIAGFTTSSISDDHSLTWTLRKQLQWNVTNGSATKMDVDVYWAHAASIATYAITATLNQNTDDSCMVCFAVSGADTTTPFDTDASLPASASDVTGSNVARQVTGISTVKADTFMFSAMSNSANQSTTTPTGFTNIASPNNGGGSLFNYLAVDYKIQTAAQSSITVAEGSNGQNWGMIVDAIKQPASEADVVAAPDMGFSEAASINFEKDLAASPAMGFGLAATVDNATAQVVASVDVGFSEAAGVEVERPVAASMAVGFSEAATLTEQRELTVAASLGFTQASRMGSAKRKQPVVCVVS